MSFNLPTLWWLAAGGLVAAELLTGTFYLLMVALGCAAGALAAHADLGGTAQVAAAALVGAGCTAAWHWKRAKAPRSQPVERNPDANLDIGQTVQVQHWSDDGSARVAYRGSTWSARLSAGHAPAPGEYVIVAVHGTQLELAPGQAR